MHFVRTLAAATLTAVNMSAFAIPALAGGASSMVRNEVFTTTFIDDEHLRGENDGTLTLQFGADGTVSGYFRSVESAANILVTGGLRGDIIYLDIGNLRPITGTYRDDRIVGFELVNNRAYRFTATRSNIGPNS